MRFHWLQHVAFEGLGAIEDWAVRRGHDLAGTRLWAGEQVPDAGSFDALVVMGGPMSVHDTSQHPWLIPEQKLIEAAIQAEKPVLGVCLGAQLIAAVLGGRVVPNAFKEIGWFSVSLAPEARALPLLANVPQSFVPFHWHGETFDVPRGATHLASSQGCANQAFVYGTRVLALQFHLEATRRGVQALVENCAGDLVEGPFVQPAGAMTTRDALFSAAHAILFKMLDRLVEASCG